MAPALVLGGLFLAAFSAGAADVPERLDLTASCADGECHTEVFAAPHPHWSEAETECRRCHAQEEDVHEFEMQEPPDLCMECHDPVAEREIVHDPAEEDCLDCHAVHASEAPKLLASSDQKELCFDCHDEDLVAEDYVHGPAESGECTQCHDPHSSANSTLLRADGADLCLHCHDDLADEMEAAEVLHEPAEDDCIDCHNPHSGAHPAMLPAEKRDLCRECHDDIVELAEESSVDHAPALTGKECLNCHSPHFAEAEPNLKEPQVQLCLGCHDEPVRSGDVTLVDIRGLLDVSEKWHEPIREGGCTECHAPHGGETFRLLKRPFPETFYTTYDRGAYDLCFECHEPTLVSSERTRTLTGFRDGDRNLHAVHVQDGKRGRTCRVCHDVHGGANGFQIRKTVPYGKWLMPLRFRSMENGGSCQPGCHTRESYDRDGR